MRFIVFGVYTDFSWVEGELCEVTVLLENPLPMELKLNSIVRYMICFNMYEYNWMNHFSKV